MAEINATLSFHMDSRHNEKHDLREIYVPYVDTERSKNNVYYKGNMTREEAFDLLFADAVAEYNSRQKRSDRHIGSYLQKLLDAEQQQKQKVQEMRSAGCSYKEIARHRKCVHPSYQFIVTVGNMQDNPELIVKDGEQADKAKLIMEEYMNGFQERNPNAFLYNGALHGDEVSVWHGHFSIIWFADDCSKGMKRQVSQKKALEAMGFYSDTVKGEDGKLHLAIEKWQNREREILREICKKHGINIVAGKGSKEHLDREHYIIKKQHEENEIRGQEIYSEHQHLMAMVNEQAGIVLSAQEDVNKQLEQIQDFLHNTEQGKHYAMYTQIDEMNRKANQYDMKKEQEKRLFAQFWDAYKSENSAYWQQYRLKKKEMFQLLQDARQGKKHNEKMLNHHLEVLTDGSENLLFKLISLIAVISLYFQKGHLEAELAKAEAGYREFKDNARVVLSASKDTSIALKSKDYDNVIQAMNNWNTIIANMNERLNTMPIVIDPKQYER